ncbi:MAG TPA: WD40 repeat domain-containing protein [Planctomycetota bacterium]|nr:WD40 repeat domain-containing protein [Planctomycetota bacterium]
MRLPRPRFTLRTLLLTVLLIASSATLWWNWDVWHHAYKIIIPNNNRVEFTSNDRFIENEYHDGSNDCMAYYDARSGVLLRTITHESKSDTIGSSRIVSGFLTSPGGEFCVWHSPYGAVMAKEVWTVETGRKMELEKWSAVSNDYLYFSPHDRYVLLGDRWTRTLVNLDSRQIVKRFDSLNELCSIDFSPDDNFLYFSDFKSQTVKRIATSTGKTQNEWSFPAFPNSPPQPFSPDGTIFVCRKSTSDRKYFTLLCDASTGSILAEIPGSFSRFSGNYVLTENPAEVWETTPSPRRRFALNAYPDGKAVQVHNGLLQFFKHANYYAGFPRDLSTWVDLNTGQEVTRMEPEYSSTENKRFALRIDEIRGTNQFQSASNVAAIIDADTCETLIDFSSPRWREFAVQHLEIEFSRTKPIFFTCKSNKPQNSQQIDAFRQNRPRAWYGPAALPEFWLTTLFALALPFSLIADRRTLKMPNANPQMPNGK